jgi:hypothetical protein
MLTEQRLSEVLQRIGSDAVVMLTRDGRRWIAEVVTTAFEGKDEADRQSDVWGLILDNLEPHEQTEVEFIFTNTPGETEDTPDEQVSDARS